MGSDERTAIRVDYEVWKYVHTRMRPGESKNDVLRRLLGLGPADPTTDEEIAEAVASMDWPHNHAHSDRRERAVVAAAAAIRDGESLDIDGIDKAALEAEPELEDELGGDTRRRMLRECLKQLHWVESAGQGKSGYAWNDRD